MVKLPFLGPFLLLLLLRGTVIAAPAISESPESSAAPISPSAFKSASDGAIITRKDARALTLKIPAPRGMIVDRHGEVIAQNRVVYQVALQYEQFEDADQDFITRWGRTRLDALAKFMPKMFVKSDAELLDHYRHRRWLPLYVSNELDKAEAQKLEPNLPAGLVLAPIYSRYYPHGDLAAHIIGYPGGVGKLPTGPINYNDPLWEDIEGRAGLEKLYDKLLTGQAGTKRLIFDEHGNKLLEEQAKRPQPGGTLVTTLDLKWQLEAEKALKKGCQRGAFVVIDVITGEVLVMASRPSFDLNAFIPGINDADFKALNEDPATPLYGRAFQSAYPPASTFKPIVALAALNEGVVTSETLINCPVSIAVGNAVFNNWYKEPEGEINVTRALARSCNTWFYQVGISAGPESFLNLARYLGYGQKSGLPLIGETPGIVPDDGWMLKHENRRILAGDTANMSIGQGSLLSSPLQVAQGMAGIGNGGILPKLWLVYQEQDSQGRVTKAMRAEPRNTLGLKPEAIVATRQGMADVVNGPGGTGHGAKLSYTKLCGKTGTAQWGPPSKNQRLAWFAGFLPAENPRYAFAVLYEGKPGERVSGGRLAAPMVKQFFEALKDEIEAVIVPPKKALIVIEDGDGTSAPTAIVVPEGEVVDESQSINTHDVVPLKALPVEPLETGFNPVPLQLDAQGRESTEGEPIRAILIDEIPESELIDDEP